MDILTIIASIAVGIVVGMAFESVYQAESRKFDHARIVALNGENIKLRKELKKYNEQRTDKAVKPAISKAEVITISDDSVGKNVDFGGF